MHPLVQILKSSLHGIGIGIVALLVICKKHIQDGMGIAVSVVGWMIRHILFQHFDIVIPLQHWLSSLPASFCRPAGSCSETADTRP